MIGQGRGGVVAAFLAYEDAMVAGDTQALEDLLDPGFVLTHMSGYRQSKQQWLAELRRGEFDYHGFENKTVDVEVVGDTARLTARTVADATVYGAHAPWRLQLAMDYVRRDSRWIALQQSAPSGSHPKNGVRT